MREKLGGWNDYSIAEFYAFLLILLDMMINPRKSIADNWADDPAINNPYIKKILPYDKFIELWRNIFFKNDILAEAADIIPVENIVD